jgi:hypothetical protein
LFWASWLNHNTANVFSTQDAHGPVRRGLVMIGCPQLSLLNTAVRPNNPQIDALTELVNFPAEREICPNNVFPPEEGAAPAQASSSSQPEAVPEAVPLEDELQPMPKELEPSIDELATTMGEGG